MRQRRWLELLKDYDTNIQYCPGTANVVADALSRKSDMIAGIKVEEEIIRDLERLGIELYVRGQHEAHSSLFSVHPGSTKMYHDLKQHFWWSGMKRDVAMFVSKCLICQQVKIEHQRASGLLQQLDIHVCRRLGEPGLSSVLHFIPRQTQSERTIQTLEDMLRSCALEWTGNWDD
nr:retrotransposon protein, putative, Ty3-gypsy subclass [Tanacetum cinerariifolium]